MKKEKLHAIKLWLKFCSTTQQVFEEHEAKTWCKMEAFCWKYNGKQNVKILFCSDQRDLKWWNMFLESHSPKKLFLVVWRFSFPGITDVMLYYIMKTCIMHELPRKIEHGKYSEFLMIKTNHQFNIHMQINELLNWKCWILWETKGYAKAKGSFLFTKV